jgi:MFS family permease
LVAQAVRLSVYLTTFAYLLAARDYLDRPALGGMMIAGGTIASIVMAPFNGALFDRFGVGRLLPLQQGICGLLMIVLLTLIWQRAPSIVIVIGCVALGGAMSASGGALRSLLNTVLPERLVDRAVAIDSLILEITVIAAPLMVVAIASIGDLGGIVAMLGAFVVSTVLAVRFLPSGPELPVSVPSAMGKQALRSRPFAFWCLVSLALGSSIGIVEVGAIAVSDRSGGSHFHAALLIVVLCCASIIAGLAWGSWGHRLGVPHIVLGVGFMLATLLAQVAVAQFESWAILVFLYAVLGATIAPSSILRQRATDDLASPAQRAQAFATIFAANALGFALAGVLHSLLSLEQALVVAGVLPLAAITVAVITLLCQAAPELDSSRTGR